MAYIFTIERFYSSFTKHRYRLKLFDLFNLKLNLKLHLELNLKLNLNLNLELYLELKLKLNLELNLKLYINLSLDLNLKLKLNLDLYLDLKPNVEYEFHELNSDLGRFGKLVSTRVRNPSNSSCRSLIFPSNIFSPVLPSSVRLCIRG